MQDTRPHDLKKNRNPAHRLGKKSAYQAPVVTDYGDVTRLTQAKGTSTDAVGSQGLNKHPYG
ncbi:MAG TPA: lasso RiPP family leader peptide-containing protein [Candidatus Binataceae bacterium]|nr:lasso RiPP family leader peptide-containing protein [Candidatus Binataceae bacterium]